MPFIFKNPVVLHWASQIIVNIFNQFSDILSHYLFTYNFCFHSISGTLVFIRPSPLYPLCLLLYLQYFLFYFSFPHWGLFLLAYLQLFILFRYAKSAVRFIHNFYTFSYSFYFIICVWLRCVTFCSF